MSAIHQLVPLALALSLSACAGGGADKGIDQGIDDGGDGGADDTGEVGLDYSDLDHDGHYAFEDCDDTNGAVYPGAPELCDGVDNNCDEVIDEGFDGDGDGFLPTDICPHGTDCDDADGDIHPDADEVPYDGIDNDCLDGDLLDVDGDGFDGGEGGPDCDDTDAAIHPGAKEIPHDGIDQNCDEADSLDADGDGHDAIDAGGADCDDGDPAVHPGALDFANDEVDSDCDGVDGASIALASLATMVTGTGAWDLLGESVATCDVNGDGQLDLVIGAPFSDGYQGSLGIFYGGPGLSGELSMADADVKITGETYFFGFGVQCGDLDGDGGADIVVSRGEINHSESGYITTHEILVFTGSRGWPSVMTDADAVAVLGHELGVPEDVLSVYALNFELDDVDGDGEDELLVADLIFTDEDGEVLWGDSVVYIVDAVDLVGEAVLTEEADWVMTMDSTNAYTGTTMLDDYLGDGSPDALVAQGWYETEEADGSTSMPGRVSLVDGIGTGAVNRPNPMALKATTTILTVRICMSRENAASVETGRGSSSTNDSPRTSVFSHRPLSGSLRKNEEMAATTTGTPSR
jgi:hypothetical protein